MNPDRIRAAIQMLYPAEMTPTARNVLENILDDEELEAPVSAGASLCPKEDVLSADKPMTPFDRAVAKAAAEFREELEAARTEVEPKPKPSWWRRFATKNKNSASDNTGAFSYPEES